MAKPVGTIEIEGRGKESVDAYRIGKFWGVNKSSETSPYFNVTHLGSGRKLTGYIKLRRAQKLVGVFDVIFPTSEERVITELWFRLPDEVKKAIRY